MTIARLPSVHFGAPGSSVNNPIETLPERPLGTEALAKKNLTEEADSIAVRLTKDAENGHNSSSLMTTYFQLAKTFEKENRVTIDLERLEKQTDFIKRELDKAQRKLDEAQGETSEWQNELDLQKKQLFTKQKKIDLLQKDINERQRTLESLVAKKLKTYAQDRWISARYLYGGSGGYGFLSLASFGLVVNKILSKIDLHFTQKAFEADKCNGASFSYPKTETADVAATIGVSGISGYKFAQISMEYLAIARNLHTWSNEVYEVSKMLDRKTALPRECLLPNPAD